MACLIFAKTQKMQKGRMMVEEIKDSMRIILEDDEFFELSAKMYRKMFVELTKSGFTDEEAVLIVAHQGKSN